MNNFKIIPNGLLPRKPKMGKPIITGTAGSVTDSEWFSKAWAEAVENWGEKRKKNIGPQRFTVYTGIQGLKSFNGAVAGLFSKTKI
jgi:hypothetical protein